MKTENLPAKAPEASKDFTQTEEFEFSAQLSQAEANRHKRLRAVESGVKEMIRSENKFEEVFKLKLSHEYTEEEGKLKGKRKQNFDEIRSDLYKHPEGNEGSSTNVLNDDVDGGINEYTFIRV